MYSFHHDPTVSYLMQKQFTSATNFLGKITIILKDCNLGKHKQNLKQKSDFKYKILVS